MTCRCFAIGLITALLTGPVSAQTNDALQEYEAESDAPVVTDVVRCLLDAATIYGPRTTATGFNIVTFQLRGDGMGIVNGRLVEPLDARLNGASSSATFSVASFDLDPRSAAMSTYLTEDQKRQLQAMTEMLSIQRSGGLPRHVTVMFSDHTIVAASVKDGEQINIVSDRCE